MHSDVHSAALKAAAKLALSVVVLGGCSGVDPLADEVEGDGEGPATNEAPVVSGSEDESSYTKAPVADASVGQPDPDQADGGPRADTGTGKATCDEVLSATFPTPGPYRWELEEQPADVVRCCDEELAKDGAMAPHRWDCCVAYDPVATPDAGFPPANPEHGAACTPWGPPVPPSMRRARRARPAPSEWIAQAVA